MDAGVREREQRDCHRMKRTPADPLYGIDVLNHAYGLGCLFCLGDRAAIKVMHAIAEGCSKNKAGRHAIVTQFRMGQMHETQRGPHIVEEAA